MDPPGRGVFGELNPQPCARQWINLARVEPDPQVTGMPLENPYQAPMAAVADIPPEGLPEAADRGSRLAAALLDLVMGPALVGIAAALAIPALLVARQGGRPETWMFGVFIGGLGAAFLGLFIWNLVWLHRYGQSIGKRLVKIRIVRADSSRAGLARIFFLRMLLPNLIGAIPLLGPLFTLVNLCFIFREDRRCLHDHIAGTLVVRT